MKNKNKCSSSGNMWTIRAVLLIVSLFPNEILPTLGLEASAVTATVKTKGDV